MTLEDTLRKNNLKLTTYFNFMKEWVYKSLENQRVNFKYSRLNSKEIEDDPEINYLIRLSISKDNEPDDLFLKKYYDICEFSRNTNPSENKDTSQQQFMIEFVNATCQLFKNQEERIQQLEATAKKLKIV